MPAKIGTDRLIDVLVPEEPISPSGWASKYRTLTRRQSARPGKWKHENSPVLVGLMDLCASKEVEEVVVVKAAQMGASEAIRNVIGYTAHQEPDPVLLVLPNEQFGRRIMGRRILPLFNDTPCLRELVSERSADTQLSQLALLNGFQLSLGWSGSPATLAADPARIVVNDEVDKFVEWVGRESDPISLGYVRTQTFEENRLIVNISTPTTSSGLISQRFDGCPVKRYPYCRCPYCGEYQRLFFQNVHWNSPDESDPVHAAEMIKFKKEVWYECVFCNKHIDERGKYKMLQKNVWASEDEVITKGGTVKGGTKNSSRVGVHLWSIHAVWVQMHQIASEFVRSKDEPIKMQNFRNSWQGEPFEERIAAPKKSIFHVKRSNAIMTQDTVPVWAGKLIASADVQKDHMWYVIRAWGHNFKSHLVRSGTVRSFDELLKVTLLQPYMFEEENIGGIHPELLVIDSGDRTDEVYQFALNDPDRIFPTKGASQQQKAPVSYRRIAYQPVGRSSYNVMLYMIDTLYYKDRLMKLITDEDVDKWGVHDGIDEDYCAQMASEHKTMVRGRTGIVRMAWQVVVSGTSNHLWDCETLNVVGADISNVGLLPDAGTIQQARSPKSDQERGEPGEGGGWVTSFRRKW